MPLPFRRYPGLTVFTIMAFVLMLGFGTWQVKRLQWKTGLIEKIENGLAASAVPLPADINIENDEFKKVKISGRFLNDKEIHIAGKYHRGQLGYYILTPLEMSNGRAVLVNRGWVPEGKIKPESRPESLISGKIEVEGIIFPPIPRRWFMPKNSLEKNVWFSTDFAEIDNFTGLKLPEYSIQQIGANNSAMQLPVPLDPQVKLRNDHLQYAVTWYLLALVLLVIYFLFMKGEQKNHAKL